MARFDGCCLGSAKIFMLKMEKVTIGITNCLNRMTAPFLYMQRYFSIKRGIALVSEFAEQ